MGPYGLGIRTEGEDNLIALCRWDDLCICDNCYKNHPRRLWPWKGPSPGDRIRNQVGFIMIRKQLRNANKYAKTSPSADCNSDQVPIVFKIES